jgi:hypothetical protein
MEAGYTYAVVSVDRPMVGIPYSELEDGKQNMPKRRLAIGFMFKGEDSRRVFLDKGVVVGFLFGDVRSSRITGAGVHVRGEDDMKSKRLLEVPHDSILPPLSRNAQHCIVVVAICCLSRLIRHQFGSNNC